MAAMQAGSGSDYYMEQMIKSGVSKSLYHDHRNGAKKGLYPISSF